MSHESRLIFFKNVLKLKYDKKKLTKYGQICLETSEGAITKNLKKSNGTNKNFMHLSKFTIWQKTISDSL